MSLVQEIYFFNELIAEGQQKGVIIEEDCNVLMTSMSGAFYALIDYMYQASTKDPKKYIYLVLRIILK